MTAPACTPPCGKDIRNPQAWTGELGILAPAVLLGERIWLTPLLNQRPHGNKLGSGIRLRTKPPMAGILPYHITTGLESKSSWRISVAPRAAKASHLRQTPRIFGAIGHHIHHKLATSQGKGQALGPGRRARYRLCLVQQAQQRPGTGRPHPRAFGLWLCLQTDLTAPPRPRPLYPH